MYILLCEARVKFFRQLLVIPAAISIAVPVAAQINLEKDNLKIKQHQIAQDISSDGYLIADSNSGNIKDDSDSLEITVTGTRNEKFVDDVPSSIDVIDLSDEKYSGFSELKDLFKYETGVSVEVDSYIPYSAASAVEGNVNIRGMVDNRVLFTQDGIRLPNAFGYSAPLAYNYDRGDFVDFNTIYGHELFKSLLLLFSTPIKPTGIPIIKLGLITLFSTRSNNLSNAVGELPKTTIGGLL